MLNAFYYKVIVSSFSVFLPSTLTIRLLKLPFNFFFVHYSGFRVRRSERGTSSLSYGGVSTKTSSLPLPCDPFHGSLSLRETASRAESYVQVETGNSHFRRSVQASAFNYNYYYTFCSFTEQSFVSSVIVSASLFLSVQFRASLLVVRTYCCVFA